MSTVFHVGFHKTGTTTLQQEFFPTVEGCAVLSPNSRVVGDEFHFLVRDLATSSDEHYSDAAIRGLVARSRDSSRVLIVSHEDLSVFHANGRTPGRLHSLVADAKVLICVREQRSMLAGRYGQYVKKGGSHSFAHYLARFGEAWMRYDMVVDDYQRRFGVGQVKVLPFEMLVQSPQRFFGELRAFIVDDGQPTDDQPTDGQPDAATFASPMVNRTLAPPTRRMVRVCNRIFIETDENPTPPLRHVSAGGRLTHKLMKLDPVWFPKMSRRLGRRDRVRAAAYAGRYAGPNARLQRLTGLSLREYGYLVDDDVVHAAV